MPDVFLPSIELNMIGGPQGRIWLWVGLNGEAGFNQKYIFNSRLCQVEQDVVVSSSHFCVWH